MHVPDLKELKEVLAGGLAGHFKEVLVEVADCPDLKSPPFSLACSGFGGKTGLVDIGGVYNVEFVANHNKFHWDLTDITNVTNLPFFIGAGATKPAISQIKDNSEFMPNVDVSTKSWLSHEAYVNTAGECCKAPYSSPEFSTLCNLFGSEGLPQGAVLHINVKTRTGSTNFVTAIRQILEKHYPTQVGLGGVFIIKKGTIKSHVMPGFPSCDVFGKDIPWLKFYQVEAPVTCYSVLMNRDLHNDEARLEHTHFVSERNDAGHYHYDVTPDTVEYDAYYALAQHFYRLDKAKKPAL
uniref:DUF1907 domain-containing protein n=1 Tax=Arcella intermedia TaxID=1963864 RepID=A0A6B2LBM0_9EUKA